jgi:hypothetical protein
MQDVETRRLRGIEASGAEDDKTKFVKNPEQYAGKEP